VKDDKRKKPEEKKRKKHAEDKDKRDATNIEFHPKVEKTGDFLKSALDMIITSTNKVFNLEDDLMPFLQKDKRPNFPLD
jgi:phage antirepressor YoqD-like protein